MKISIFFLLALVVLATAVSTKNKSKNTLKSGLKGKAATAAKASHKSELKAAASLKHKSKSKVAEKA